MRKTVMVLICLLMCISVYSDDNAKWIIDRMEDVMDYDSLSFDAVMKNNDKLGETSMAFTAYQKGDGDTLLLVTSGLDKGQKILRLEDEIYIYYPDADEVVRLSGSGLKNSFLGSDFSYEDLTGDDDYEDRYEYELLGEESFEGIECYRVLFVAKKLSETYQREEMLIDKERFVPLKQSLFSRSGRLQKEIFYSDYTESMPLYPTSVRTQNAIKKSNSSELRISALSFNEDLNESLFDKEELQW